MSAITIDAMAATWNASAPGAWTLAISAQASFPGPDGSGMTITALAAPSLANPPQAEHAFAPALDLSNYQELRFWFRCDLAGDGSSANPFYLVIEAAAAPGAATPWSRFLAIARPGAWELQRIWIGDMPAALRSSIGALRLRALSNTTAFNAAIAPILAVDLQPISDVEAAWAARLDGTLSVPVSGVPTPIPLYLATPTGPQTAPYILLTAWAALPLQDLGASAPIVDNASSAGVAIRPPPGTIQLDYRLEVVATDRSLRAVALGALVTELQRARWLMVAGEQVTIEPFELSPEERGLLVTPDTTPLFYRLLQSVELGTRVTTTLARPLLTVGPLDGKDTAETMAA